MNSNMIADTLLLEAATQSAGPSTGDVDSTATSRVQFDKLTESASAVSASFLLPNEAQAKVASSTNDAQQHPNGKQLARNVNGPNAVFGDRLNLRFTWNDIVWRNVIAFVYLHASALYGIYLILFGNAKLSTFFIGYAYGTIGAMGITAGAHRHWAHKAFKAKWPLKIILTVGNTIAFQNSIYEWVRDHRVHHKFTDTDADPHNVSRGMFFAHMGWLMIKKHPDVKAKGASIDMKDLEEDPFVMFQKKYYMLLMPLLSFLIPTLLPYYLTGETLANSWYIGGMLRYTISLHSTWLVNSAAHIWGYKPYDATIKSSNNIFVAVAAFGEGWHNYHHVFPWDYKTSELGDYGFNLTTGFIDFFARIGWAYDLKTVSEEMIVKRAARTGDGTNHFSRAIPAGGAKLDKFDDAAATDKAFTRHQQHHHHDHDNMIWGWDDKDMAEVDRKDALIINKKNA